MLSIHDEIVNDTLLSFLLPLIENMKITYMHITHHDGKAELRYKDPAEFRENIRRDLKYFLKQPSRCPLHKITIADRSLELRLDNDKFICADSGDFKICGETNSTRDITAYQIINVINDTRSRLSKRMTLTLPRQSASGG